MMIPEFGINSPPAGNRLVHGSSEISAFVRDAALPFALSCAYRSATEGRPHAGDVGEGSGEAGGARAVPQSDRGRCPRFRGGRARLPALQRSAGRAGPERLLLLRSLSRPGGAGGASGGTPLRRVAR